MRNAPLRGSSLRANLYTSWLPFTFRSLLNRRLVRPVDLRRAWRLMTIYYLQVDPAVHLPVLPTSIFDGSHEVPPGARRPWRCDQPRAALLCGFFRFFATEFNWGNEAARRGRSLGFNLMGLALGHFGYSGLGSRVDPFALGPRLCFPLYFALFRDEEAREYSIATSPSTRHAGSADSKSKSVAIVSQVVLFSLQKKCTHHEIPGAQEAMG